MKFVVIADTHAKHRLLKLPPGDVIIHAGDVSYRGENYEIVDFLKWFGALKFKHKIFIAGNHDFFFEKAKQKVIESIIPPNVIYLNDALVEIEGCRIWGSPVTPQFYHWAFNRSRGEAIRKHWNLIPDDINILVTHGPPYRILDLTMNEDHVGCKDLLQRVQQIRPQVHLFGHIHEAYGNKTLSGTHFVNASVVNENYDLRHKPYIFDWKPEKVAFRPF